jgi:hypothetical protein
METRNFVHKFLCADKDEMSAEEAQSSLTTIKDSGIVHHNYLLVAAHLMFRYRLLDVVADALDVPPHPSLEQVPRSPRPQHNVDRMQKVRVMSLKQGTFTQQMPDL